MNISQITMSVLAGTSSKIAESMVSHENDIALAVALDKPVVNPVEFTMMKLGDLYEVQKTKLYMDTEHSFTSDKDYFVIEDGGVGKIFKVNGKYSITSDNIILVQKEENAITHEYVYYYMSLNNKSLRKMIMDDGIMEFPIQLPPLSIQQEIVDTMVRIYNFNRKSEQMVEDVKAQMVAIMKSVRSRGFNTKKLEDIVTHDNVKMDKGEGNAISIRKSGASTVVDFHERKYWVRDCLIIIPKTSDCNIRYLYYYMKLNNLTSTVRSIEWDDIKDISVPIPPIEFQSSVLDRMRNLDSQQEQLIYLQKTSTYNARFILEPYLPQLFSKSTSPLFTSFIL